MPVDLILHSGRILTMDDDDRMAEAIAVEDETIIKIGRSAEILTLAGAETEVVDLGGRTVLPGFIDTHTHLELTALGVFDAADCRTPPCVSIEEVLERLRAKAAVTPPGQWVFGQGALFQDMKMRDKRYPTRQELDGVSREHPILVRFSYHVTVLNSLALERCGVTRDTPDPPGGAIERDPRTGDPTGLLKDMYYRLPLPAPSEALIRAALAETGRSLFLANGITTLHEISQSPLGLRVLADLVRRRELPLRVVVYVQVPGTAPLEPAVRRDLPEVGFDDRWFVFGGIKLFADGGFSARAAALREPYRDHPHLTGRLSFSAEELAGIIKTAESQGVQLCIHTNGDRAQEVVFDGFERVFGPRRQGIRHRLEHVGNVLCTDWTIERLHRLGLLPVPNAHFIHVFGDFLADYLGEARARGAFPLRRLLAEGFPLPGNSDTTGTDPRTTNPFFGMKCALRRETYLGRVLDPDQRLTVREALRMYTRDAAVAAGEECSKGSLEPGKLADLVVLGGDPLSWPSERYEEIPVEMTIVGGRRAYVSAPAAKRP